MNVQVLRVISNDKFDNKDKSKSAMQRALRYMLYHTYKLWGGRGPEKVAANFCPYRRQILTNLIFNFFSPANPAENL